MAYRRKIAIDLSLDWHRDIMDHCFSPTSRCDVCAEAWTLPEGWRWDGESRCLFCAECLEKMASPTDRPLLE